MNELIKIEQKDGIETVNARDLHEFIRSKQDFSDWIKSKIEKYSFIENEDFTIIQGKSTGGRPAIEYFISIDMAKELSMVENNEQGKQARRYFIEMEKVAKTFPSLREKSKKARNELTSSWQAHGANAPKHFINLTYAEYGSIGYEKPKSVKKADMSRQELARLAAFEALETLKLETRTDIKGYYELKDSLHETGAAFETAERMMILGRL